MQISPSTHFVSFAQAMLYRGAGFDMVWKDCAVIAALGLAFFGISLVRFSTYGCADANMSDPSRSFRLNAA